MKKPIYIVIASFAFAPYLAIAPYACAPSAAYPIGGGGGSDGGESAACGPSFLPVRCPAGTAPSITPDSGPITCGAFPVEPATGTLGALWCCSTPSPACVP